MEQVGLFGDRYEPGKYTPEELEQLTGEPAKKPKAKTKVNQPTFFDIGKKTDLPGQQILFDD